MNTFIVKNYFVLSWPKIRRSKRRSSRRWLSNTSASMFVFHWIYTHKNIKLIKNYWLRAVIHTQHIVAGGYSDKNWILVEWQGEWQGVGMVQMAGMVGMMDYIRMLVVELDCTPVVLHQMAHMDRLVHSSIHRNLVAQN